MLLAKQAMTNVANSQGSLSHRCHAGCFGKPTDGCSVLPRAADGTVAFNSKSSATVMLLEGGRNAGMSGDVYFTLVKAGNCMGTTSPGSSSRGVSSEDERDVCRCRPCFVFSQ